MKRSFLCVFVLGCFLSPFALVSQVNLLGNFKYLSDYDKSALHYGFYIGAPFYNYKVVPNKSGTDKETRKYLVESRSGAGISSGLILEYGLTSNIHARFTPGITYATRELHFNNNSDPSHRLRHITSAFLDVPVGFKFSSDRLGNYRPYLTTDFRYSFDLESNEKQEQDNADEVFRTKTNNFMCSFGIGIDIFFQYFKFSVGSNYIFGLNNEAVADRKGTPANWTGTLDYITTSGVTFYISFEI